MKPIFAILAWTFFALPLLGKNIYVHHSVNIISNNTYYYNPPVGNPITTPILPGDRLVLLPDPNSTDNSRIHLQLNNVVGAPGLPIEIANPYNTVININPDHTYGIYLNNCKFIKINGNGVSTNKSDDRFYGIQIRIKKAGQSIKAEKGSSFIDVNRVWADVNPNIPDSLNSPAFLFKSNAICVDSVVYYSEKTFLMQDVFVRNCRISNASGEAIYIGETSKGNKTPCMIKTQIELSFNDYTGELIDIKKQTVNQSTNVIKPHYIDNVQIQNNIIEDCGWDAIQISRAHNFVVSHNEIYNYGTKDHDSHKSGIIIGEGASGDIFNNLIYRGSGWGIQARPSGNLRIFNNYLVESGHTGAWPKGKYHAAINTHTINLNKSFAYGANSIGEKTISIAHNLVVRPIDVGIRMNCDGCRSNGIPILQDQYEGVLIGNVVLQPIIKNTGLNVARIQSGADDNDMNNGYPLHRDYRKANLTYYNPADAKLQDISNSDPTKWDITPTKNSPLIDKAPIMPENNVPYEDFYGNIRPPYVPVKVSYFQGSGSAPDFGPVERIISHITEIPSLSPSSVRTSNKTNQF
ncbi:right-handed parallel beta-helix repeat-containing protein [Luteibaculum oceani]|uniref:Right-handed parallel beta-helix repeat-containing protein n=1 Tax=Luteibaculum oceani TaxID=1294296 RepID=A0A5C6VIK8_9FLAO|nr:right-handed parallel beta-helix repeat-containing protein [Luteibaculum oceani]TXC85223.1 right-handed parallel beta-helix repeat-containing protein [Luteibaculum oceani]